MNPVREKARAVRLRIEAGGLLSMVDAVAACVTFKDALSAFDGCRENDEGRHVPLCCGGDTEVNGNWLGQIAKCPRCNAEIRDAIGPFSSPFLERGNSFVSIPSEEFIKLFGDRNWIVMHEGDRP